MNCSTAPAAVASPQFQHYHLSAPHCPVQSVPSASQGWDHVLASHLSEQEFAHLNSKRVSESSMFLCLVSLCLERKEQTSAGHKAQSGRGAGCSYPGAWYLTAEGWRAVVHLLLRLCRGWPRSCPCVHCCYTKGQREFTFPSFVSAFSRLSGAWVNGGEKEPLLRKGSAQMPGLYK